MCLQHLRVIISCRLPTFAFCGFTSWVALKTNVRELCTQEALMCIGLALLRSVFYFNYYSRKSRVS